MPIKGPNKSAGSFEKNTDSEILIPPAPANGSITLTVHFNATVTATKSAVNTNFLVTFFCIKKLPFLFKAGANKVHIKLIHTVDGTLNRKKNLFV